MKSIKRIKNIIVITIIFIPFLSCEAQYSPIEQDLMKCINEKVNRYIMESYGKEPFDFYDFILRIEQELIGDQILPDRKKSDYLASLRLLIVSSGVDRYSKFYNKQNNIIEEYGLRAFSAESIFNTCPSYIVENTKKSVKERDLIYSQGVILNRLMANGFDDEELIVKLLETTSEKEFSKIVYRAPVILLVMINIDLKFNPAEPMEKFEVEGKTYFRPKKTIKNK